MKSAMEKLLVKDKSLKVLFKRHGDISFEPQLKRNPYESLVRAIAYQQLHAKAAETILSRLLAKFSKKKFPEPQDIAKLSVEDLRSCGFSLSKAKSILDIAQKAMAGVVPDKKKIKKMENEEIVESLTQIYGVGRWTVEMLLIFQLGRLNVWPSDDFGVRKGLQIWKRLKEMPKPKEAQAFGRKWEPSQTVVALYLWKEADLAKMKKVKKGSSK